MQEAQRKSIKNKVLRRIWTGVEKTDCILKPGRQQEDLILWMESHPGKRKWNTAAGCGAYSREKRECWRETRQKKNWMRLPALP